MLSCLGKSLLDRVKTVTEIVQVTTRVGGALEDQLVVRYRAAGHSIRSERGDDDVASSMRAFSLSVG